jgi:hypothetical protein
LSINLKKFVLYGTGYLVKNKIILDFVKFMPEKKARQQIFVVVGSGIRNGKNQDPG